MQSTVDVMEWDKKSPHAHLNTGFIQLLEQRGAPNEFFLSLAKQEVDELLQVSKTYELLQSRYQARVFSRENQDMFDDDILLRMLHARVPLNEPVMLCKVNKFISKELGIFKEKVRVLASIVRLKGQLNSSVWFVQRANSQLSKANT
jgi:hypothetical protein